MARPNRSDYQETQEHISFTFLDDFGVPNFRTSQYQTDSNSVWLTVSCWIFNSSISHKRQDAQLRDGNAWRGRSMHAQTSRLQLATFRVGIPNEKRCWCYPINLLSWDILAVRYGCLMLYAAYHLWTLCLHAHATHSMVPGPLGQFDDDDLIVNRTTRTTLYFQQDQWNKWCNLATSSWDVCGTVLL